MTAKKTTAQRLDESWAEKNVSIARLREELLNIKLDRAEQKLAWAYVIMVVVFGLLGGFLLEMLTR